MFCKNGVHENFSKLIRKQLCWCLFFLKLQSTCTGVSFLITLQASRLQLIKKEAPTKVLSCKFCEYLWKAASVFCRSSLGCSEDVQRNTREDAQWEKMFRDVLWRCSEKHVRTTQKVKRVLMWNRQHIIFIWRRRYWQIFKSALVYL